MSTFKNKLLVVQLSTLFFLAACDFSYAADHKWKVTKVIDGDTLKVQIEKFPEELANHLSIRVLGVDTPEKGKRAKCDKERKLGESATAFTTKMLLNSREVIFKDIKWDKYGGRILAHVIIDGKRLDLELIKANLAREYHGEKKKGWCK